VVANRKPSLRSRNGKSGKTEMGKDGWDVHIGWLGETRDREV